MKKIGVLIVMIFCLVSCDTEDGWDCTQTAGALIQRTIEVDTFNKILVNRDVELILKQGDDFEVIVETGEHLISDVTVRVINNRLELSDDNSCNYVRDYGITKIYVTAPDIKEIRNSSQFEVRSDGVLSYPSLLLISEDFTQSEAFAVGDFRLEVAMEGLRISSNSISSYYVSGTVNNLEVRFFAGEGRFEGEHLIAQNVTLYHRGSNDMIVNPQQSLSGEMLGTGNVISMQTPPSVDVDVLYIGDLIFLN
jgi:hypothetical protein